MGDGNQLERAFAGATVHDTCTTLYLKTQNTIVLMSRYRYTLARDDLKVTIVLCVGLIPIIALVG